MLRTMYVPVAEQAPRRLANRPSDHQRGAWPGADVERHIGVVDAGRCHRRIQVRNLSTCRGYGHARAPDRDTLHLFRGLAVFLAAVGGSTASSGMRCARQTGDRAAQRGPGRRRAASCASFPARWRVNRGRSRVRSGGRLCAVRFVEARYSTCGAATLIASGVGGSLAAAESLTLDCG